MQKVQISVLQWVGFADSLYLFFKYFNNKINEYIYLGYSIKIETTKTI